MLHCRFFPNLHTLTIPSQNRLAFHMEKFSLGAPSRNCPLFFKFSEVWQRCGSGESGESGRYQPWEPIVSFNFCGVRTTQPIFCGLKNLHFSMDFGVQRYIVDLFVNMYSRSLSIQKYIHVYHARRYRDTCAHTFFLTCFLNSKKQTCKSYLRVIKLWQ